MAGLYIRKKISFLGAWPQTKVFWFSPTLARTAHFTNLKQQFALISYEAALAFGTEICYTEK